MSRFENVTILDKHGNEICTNYPLSVDGDSIYVKDIDLDNSSVGTFTGSISSLFDETQNELIDTTATNPKQITIEFERTVYTSSIGISSKTGDFSNVKIKLKSISGDDNYIVDDSANNTKYKRKLYRTVPQSFCCLVLEFHTTDNIKIANISIPKTQQRTIAGIEGFISKVNSSKSPLDISGSFIGEVENIVNYGTIVVSTYSDVDSGVNGLSLEQSTDGINWDHKDPYTIPANKGKTFSIQTAAKFFRVVYTNGSVAQNVFRLQSSYKPVYVKPSSHRVNDIITGEDDAELMKSNITAKSPDGLYVNIGATRLENLRVSVQENGDTPAIDAFDRLRVSNPFTLYDSKNLHDKQPLFWDESIGGSATSVHNPVNAEIKMSVTANSADYVIRQTKQRFNYQPGKSQLIFMTFHSPQSPGITNRIGIFDGTGVNNLEPNNGIFFESDGSVSWNICKDGIITETVLQNDWNFDKLDGTGKSAITLDLTAPQIMIIDFEWLGVGRVRVGFVIDGLIQYCHYFNHSNITSFDSVYMSTPNLPLRYSIETNGTSVSHLDHICSTVMSEGGVNETGILRSVDTGITHINADVLGTTYAVIGIKLKSLYNDVTVVPEYFSMLSTTNDAYRWSILLNPTISGTFTYTDVLNSAIQKAVGVTANVVTGSLLVIDSGYSSIKSDVNRKISTSLRLGSKIDGTLDTIVLCATPLGANTDILGSLTIRELL